MILLFVTRPGFQCSVQSVSSGIGFCWQYFVQELTDFVANLTRVRLQREMPGLKEMDLGIRIVALESFGAGRQEEWIVLSPNREQRWLPRAEIVLKLRVKRDIACIVQEEV